MIPYFQDLGNRIAADCGTDLSALHEVAHQHLQQSPAPASVTLEEVLRWASTVPEERFPKQLDLGTTFGEPPITVFFGGEFCIDVNLWATSSTQIHEHAFRGAFQVLAGSSLQSRYVFHKHRTLGPDLDWGALEFLGAERLGVGDTWAIDPGPTFIHGLFHLNHPSATVVVRTLGEPSFLPQRSFDPPGLAYDAAFRTRLSPVEQRRLQLVQFLASTNAEDGQARLGEILATASPMLRYSLLADVLPMYWARQPSSLGSLDAAVGAAFQGVSWKDQETGACLERAARARLNRNLLLAQRRHLTAVEDREVAGVLLCAPDRAAVEVLLRSIRPRASPEDVLLAFLERLGRVGDSDALGQTAGVRATLAALIRGERPHATEQVRELTDLSLFAPWFRIDATQP